MAIGADVDWLEAGIPLILAEGLHGVRKLRRAFLQTPVVQFKNDGWRLSRNENDGKNKSHRLEIYRSPMKNNLNKVKFFDY
jgi:hypothetical protein